MSESGFTWGDYISWRSRAKDAEARAEAAEAALADTRRALEWYDDHKREDGSYDGEMWGDLHALDATDSGKDEA